MKGVILAAGKSSRLFPSTHHISKALLPVYDKPMIYYPLSTLIQLGVTDIMVITSAEDKENFYSLLKFGEMFGVNIQYAIQEEKHGIADALLIAEDFIKNDSVVLTLCDNILLDDASEIIEEMEDEVDKKQNSILFCTKVNIADAYKYGIFEFKEKAIVAIHEKPTKPTSDCASIGLYIYPKGVSSLVKTLKPSLRGELEITDLNNKYIASNRALLCSYESNWFDAGTEDALLKASIYVKERQEKDNALYGSPELSSYKRGLLPKTALQRIALLRRNSTYYSKLYQSIEELEKKDVE